MLLFIISYYDVVTRFEIRLVQNQFKVSGVPIYKYIIIIISIINVINSLTIS